MDPNQNYKQKHNPNNRRNFTNPRNGESNMSGNDDSPANFNANAADNANGEITSQTNTELQKSDAFTTVMPNESRRSKLTMMAQKEEEDLQRWKETHRLTSVNLPPEKLGGSVSLNEARERQRHELHRSKLQKRMKKDELDKRRRQEEEEELEKMKAKQREKAERLEERRHQDQLRRRQQFEQDQLRTNDSYLRRLEQRGPAVATHSSPSQSCPPEDLESQREKGNPALSLGNQEQRTKTESLEENRRRVNSAFLDKLECGHTGARGEAESESQHGDLRAQEFQDFQTCLSDPDPQPGSSCWAEESEVDPDYEWAVTKLENTFPFCSRIFLEDILLQCSGDYQQASALLNDTLH